MECSSTEIKKLKSFSIFFIFRFFETQIILKIAAILVSWELGRFNQKFKLSSVCQSFEVLINQFTWNLARIFLKTKKKKKLTSKQEPKFLVYLFFF